MFFNQQRTCLLHRLPEAFEQAEKESPHIAYQLQKLLADSDIALLPSNPRDISKAGVSHNRLVDALRGGVVPIASPMPSYLELSESSLIGSDFSEMIEYAEDRYTSLSQKFAKLREIILKDHSPQQNIINWINTIEYHF